MGLFQVHVSDGPLPAVVCWPSLLGDHHSMREFAEQLAPQHRIVLIDPPGMGINRHMTQWPLLSEQVIMARHILDGLKIDDCHWVGHGFGGLIGVGVVTLFASRIRSLTLTSVPFVQAARASLVSEMMLSLLAPTRWGRRLIAHSLAKQITKNDSKERALVRAGLIEVLDHGNMSVIKLLHSTPVVLLEQLREMLQDMNIMTLVIAGQHDKTVLQRDQHTTAEIIKSARYHEVDAGFMTLLIRPQECAELFMQFLQDVDSNTQRRATRSYNSVPK